MTTLVRGLSPARAQLDNGVVVLAQQTSTAPALTINVNVKAGSAQEPGRCPGLAYLTAKMLDRGTERRPDAVIAGALDDRGVALRVSASRHAVTISATCLAEDFAEVFAIVADVSRRPVFPDSQLQRRKMEVITRLKQDEDNPFLRAGDALFVLLYGGDHPYGRPIKGTVASVDSLERGDLAAFHARWFQPSAVSLAVVGDVTPEEVMTRAALEFGDWRGDAAGLTIVPLPPPAVGRRRLAIPMPGKAQADVAYGFTTVSRLDPRYYAYWMMNHILGEFGLGGRLAANIRERQGMAYYAFSVVDATLGEGPLVVRAGVDPVNVERAITAIDSEVAQLGREGPTPSEIEETRQCLVGGIPRLLETNESIAGFLQVAEFFGLGLDYDRRLPGLIEAVTRDEVAAAAADVLRPDRAAIVVAGPPEGDA